jgi:hypothetical protein
MAFTSTGGNTNPATGANVGTRESIYEKIKLIGADDTPILSLMGTSSVTNIQHSWLIDNIADPSRNPQLEISDFNDTGTNTKQKKQNAVEIFKNDIQVSKTMEKVATYGGKEMSYQTKKRVKEHKLAMEMAVLGLGRDSDAKVSVFKTPTTRDNATAGAMGGFFHYLAKGATTFTNGKRGNVITKDDVGDWSGSPTTLDETVLHELLQTVWDSGETPRDVFLGAALKPAINAMASRQFGNEKSVNTSVVSVDTDFGKVNFRMHRMLSEANGLGDTLLAGNFEYSKMGLLYPTEIEDVKTDKTAKAKRIYTEGCLEVRNADAFVAGVGLKA